MDKLKVIVEGMKSIYDFANEFTQEEGISILVGTLVTYCVKNHLPLEHVIDVVRYSYYKTLDEYNRKGGETD